MVTCFHFEETIDNNFTLLYEHSFLASSHCKYVCLQLDITNNVIDLDIEKIVQNGDHLLLTFMSTLDLNEKRDVTIV